MKLNIDAMAKWSVMLGITVPVISTVVFPFLMGSGILSWLAGAIMIVSIPVSLIGFLMGVYAAVRSNIRRSVPIMGAVMNLLFLGGYASYQLMSALRSGSP